VKTRQFDAGRTSASDANRPVEASPVAPGATGAVATASDVRVVVGGRIRSMRAIEALPLLERQEATLPEDVTVGEQKALIAEDDRRRRVGERTLRLELVARSGGSDMPDRFGRGEPMEPGWLSGRRW
jgi:hypothetical protein